MSDKAKHNAALEALQLVENGMTLGLGTGSTADWFVRELGQRVKDGLQVQGAPTSKSTEKLAQEVGVPLVDLDTAPQIHLTVDGADEFDNELRLIKGGGAALLREKIIADASDRMVVIADATKAVEQLGKFPLPVEVNPFGLQLTRKRISDELTLAGMNDIDIVLRMQADGAPLITDGGHHILDVHCKAIPDADWLDQLLNRIPGVVEHGLFVSLADAVIVGTDTGARMLSR